MFGSRVLRHPTLLLLLLPVAVLIVALLLGSSPPLARNLPALTKKVRDCRLSAFFTTLQPQANMPKTPVYFFSHGGVSMFQVLTYPGT